MVGRLDLHRRLGSTVSAVSRPALTPGDAFRSMVMVAVATGFSTVLLAGCSSTPGPALAMFRPARGATPQGLAADVRIINSRLSQLGDASTSAEVHGHNIVLYSTKSLPASALAAIASTGNIQLRPVTCFAPPYSGTPTSAALPETCSAPQYDLTASNLQISVDSMQPANTVGPDPALAAFASSTPTFNDTHPNSEVLLPAAPESGQAGVRYLLGSAQVTNSGLQSMVAQHLASTWGVLVTLTETGAVQWDELASHQFHAYIAVDIDGQVESAPLNQPGQQTFSSFQGKVQIAGNFTEQTARGIAAMLNSGPLPVPLTRTAS